MWDGWVMHGIGGGLMMFAFWLILIGGVILFVKWIADGNKAAQDTNASPFEILQKRYAKGEITKEEFESKRKDLGATPTDWDSKQHA